MKTHSWAELKTKKLGKAGVKRVQARVGRALTRRQHPHTVTRTATIVKQEIVAEETIQSRVLFKLATELEHRALGTTSYPVYPSQYPYPPPYPQVRSALEAALWDAAFSSYRTGTVNPSLTLAYYQIAQELRKAAEALNRSAPPTLPVPEKKKRSRKK